MGANSQLLRHAVEDIIAPDAPGPLPAAAVSRHPIEVRIAERIEDVEAVWRQLSATMESPGQSYDFIRLWIGDRNIPASAQRFVVGEIAGRPIALLPLHLKRIWGVKVLTWFPGSNAGCYAPLVDRERLAALGPGGRAELWRAMVTPLSGAGLLFLRSIPTETTGHAGLFDELGTALETDILYRSQFESWEQCDREQRSRSRRKHDRQQGDRLAALGNVSFEEIRDPDAAHPVIDVMFQQRSERFRVQGIRDCFVEDDLIGFYHDAIEPESGLDVRLHVLRLDGEVVAVRYNIVHGDRMFCLISSMSDSPRIQGGSPGKQCLLQVMQNVFDQGFRVFDMGSGLTDEKRHWCNVQVPVRHHYVGLTPIGRLVAGAHGNYQRLRIWAKANPTIKTGLRNFQQMRDRRKAKPVSDEL